jgi:hypothetical protein
MIAWNGITINFYDGDSTDPALPPNSIYGNLLTLTDYNLGIFQNKRARLVPNKILPWLGATLYRPSFSYPALSATKTALTIQESWFYGVLDEYFSSLSEPLQISPFIKGEQSRFFVTSLAGYANRANYDYIYYLGSFPKNSGSVSFTLGIKNHGETDARIVTYSNQRDPAFTQVSIPASFPKYVNKGQELTPHDFTFNTSTAGEHWMEVDYSFEDGTHIDPLIYVSSGTPQNIGTAQKVVRNHKILVVGHVMDTGTYPQLSLAVQDYDVVQNDGVPPTETIQPAVNVTTSWNTAEATNSLVFDSIRLTKAATPNDAYAKKKLIFTNNTLLPIEEFRFLYRADVNTHITKVLGPNFTLESNGTTCSNNQTLLPGESCAMVLKYQPSGADASETFIATLHYRAGTGRYLMQNVGISHLPRSPGFLQAKDIAPENINYKVTPTSGTSTRSSYPLSFGTSNIFLNVVPKEFSFSQNSGTYKKMQITNTQNTKASMLLSYQRYLSSNSLRGYSPAITAPSSIVPEASEYRTVDGVQYARIHLLKYTDNSERLVIEASRACFFGDDENNNAIPAHQKGFNLSTVTPCFLIATFKANFEYLQKNINILNGDDMRGTAAELWYFSVNRSSTASFWIHVKGYIQPDLSIASVNYGNVTAFDTPSVSFSAPKFTAANTAVGNIVGIRILISQSLSGLASPYSSISTYVDIRPYDPNNIQMANITNHLARAQFFYFRAVAIRYDSRFVDTNPKKFIGLNPGEYLSAANNLANPLTLVVPPLNHYYFHNEKLIVDKGLTGQNFEKYSNSSARCTGRARMTLKNPGTTTWPYRLISKQAYNLILAKPAASNYPNWDQTFHWLSDNPVGIDQTFGGQPGFLANQVSQLLVGPGIYYIRNSSNPATPVNQAMGGIPGTSYANFYSLVEGDTPFGSARCMVVLP